MKKTFKTFVPLALAGLALAGCGKTSADGKTNNLNIYVVKMGYGRTWLDELAKKYREKTGIKVSISQYDGQDGASTMDTAIDGGGAVDLVFTKRGNFESDIYLKKSVKGHAPLYEDLTESVYNYTVEGEDKTIGEKIYDSMEDYYSFDGVYYGVPWASGFMGIARNKTIWNAMGYTDKDVPYTTKQLYRLCDDIYEKHYVYPGTTPASQQVYPFIYSSRAEYYSSVVNVWTAQYEGKDAMDNHFLKGYGPEETTSNENFYTYDGQSAALEVLDELLNGNGGKRQNPAKDVEFTTTQNYFYSGDGVFMINGSWLENESGSSKNGVEIDFIKTPVVSSIVERMSIKDDADADTKLAGAIQFVDSHPNKGDNAGAPLPNEDMEIVREARGYSYLGGGMDHQAFVTAYGKNKANAVDFLRFMYSDEGLNIFRNAMNGITLPATPCTPYSDLTGEQSTFKKSVVKALDEGSFFFESRKAKFFCLGGVDLHFCNGSNGANVVTQLLGGAGVSKKTPDEIMTTNMQYIQQNLKTITDKMKASK